MLHRFIAAVICASGALIAAPALAESTPTSPAHARRSADDPISVAALIGYGVNNSNGSSGDIRDVYGLGLGVRAGYTIPWSVYLGASFLYHLGFSKDLQGGGKASGHFSELDVEAGYDLDLGPVTLRPFFGLGVAFTQALLDERPVTPSFTGGNGHKLVLSPGLAAVYNAPFRLFAGLDVRYTFLRGGDAENINPAGGSRNGLGLYATLGYRI